MDNYFEEVKVVDTKNCPDEFVQRAIVCERYFVCLLYELSKEMGPNCAHNGLVLCLSRNIVNVMKASGVTELTPEHTKLFTEMLVKNVEEFFVLMKEKDD